MIYFLRHCKTYHNADNLICGQSESKLVEHPIVLNDFIFPKGDVKIFSSPSSRCLETANLLSLSIDNNTKIIRDARLLERNMGDWEGEFKDAIITKNPNMFIQGCFIPQYTPPNGETFAAFRDRLQFFYDELINNVGTIVISSHNQSLKMLYCILLGIDLDNAWPRTGFKNGIVQLILNQ